MARVMPDAATPPSSRRFRAGSSFPDDQRAYVEQVDGLPGCHYWGRAQSGTLQGAGGIGGLLANREGANSYWYFYDGNGNVTEVLTPSVATGGLQSAIMGDWLTEILCDPVSDEAAEPIVEPEGGLESGLPGDGQMSPMSAGSPGGGGSSDPCTVLAHYEYDPYGGVLYSSGTYAATNPFRFSTKWIDTELGSGKELYYFGYRYYWPRLGRWGSWDPMGERGGANLYGYVQNDPGNSHDALGLRKRTLQECATLSHNQGFAANCQECCDQWMEFPHEDHALCCEACLMGINPFAGLAGVLPAPGPTPPGGGGGGGGAGGGVPGGGGCATCPGGGPEPPSAPAPPPPPGYRCKACPAGETAVAIIGMQLILPGPWPGPGKEWGDCHPAETAEGTPPPITVAFFLCCKECTEVLVRDDGIITVQRPNHQPPIILHKCTYRRAGSATTTPHTVPQGEACPACWPPSKKK